MASIWLREANGIILDLISLLTVHRLNLAELLRQRYGHVLVPQHVIDEIQQAVFMEKVMGHTPFFFGKSDGGQYTLSETSDAYQAQYRTFLHSVSDFAESFERVGSYRVLEIDDIESWIDTVTYAGVGSVFFGDGRSDSEMILVTDDLGLSMLAHEFQTPTVNSQAVLNDLLQHGMLQDDEYAVYVERLVMMNYRGTRISAKDIVFRLASNGYLTSEGTRAMMRSIRGPDCTESSAVSVAVEVIAQLAGETPLQQLELILDLLLVNMKRGRSLQPVLHRFFRLIQSHPNLSLLPHVQEAVLQTIALHSND